MQKDRPFLVTLVCLFLLLSNTYFLVKSFEYLNKPATQEMMQRIPVPAVIQVTMYYLNLVICLVTAMFMMQEKNWARWVYIVWGFVNIDYNFYINADWHDNLIGIGTYLVFALIFLVPSANEYFVDVPYTEL